MNRFADGGGTAQQVTEKMIGSGGEVEDDGRCAEGVAKDSGGSPGAAAAVGPGGF